MDNQSMKHSLELYKYDKLIFTSNGHWIYPLFELETFLQTSNIPVQNLLVRDKIVGRAAALLLVRLGFSRIEADILSKVGEKVLLNYQVNYKYRILVEKIGCQTENLLAEILDPEEAHTILLERIHSQNPDFSG